MNLGVAFDAAGVGLREPRGKLAGGLVRCLSVERHHRGWYAGHPSELGSPPVADWPDFNTICAAGDGFFETMDHVGVVTFL